MTPTPHDAGTPAPAAAPIHTPGCALTPGPSPHPLAGRPAYAVQGRPAPPVGKVRSTGVCFLLLVVTFGIYSLFWYHGTHSEMQRHRGAGIGGGLAVLLGFFVGFVMLFITPSEVGGLYTARGQRAPVSAATGCWILLPVVGAIVWFVKTNGALNAYWRSVGAA